MAGTAAHRARRRRPGARRHSRQRRQQRRRRRRDHRRPRQAAQEDVIRLTHERAGTTPDEVQYVELHGTGTKAGDPVEAAALGAALGNRRTSPLPVRSVKTNLGHTEGAAGITGLLKTVLAIHHRALPATLNHVTPGIPLDELNLDVVTESRPWPEPDAPLVADVSSFGVTTADRLVTRPDEMTS
ncbi:polyketide synthase [Streptomyces californicus]|uniref:beta-ketoacyl [acyl carrier protein] synthase domain-containing protein n=1 Tax=Streptomyces californicus TaxID=67351 RepID=UPI0036A36A0C